MKVEQDSAEPAPVMVPKRGRSRPKPEPLEVKMTLRFTFGDEPGDSVTVMNDRRVPLVGGIFASRDRIVRGFAVLLVKTGMAQPKVLREIIPALNLLRHLRPGGASLRKAGSGKPRKS